MVPITSVGHGNTAVTITVLQLLQERLHQLREVVQHSSHFASHQNAFLPLIEGGQHYIMVGFSSGFSGINLIEKAM